MKPALLKITSSIAGNRLVLSPNWITNGHWAIKRELVVNGKKLTAESISTFFCGCIPTEIDDLQLSKAVTCDPELNEKYEMSPMLLSNSFTMRVFFTQTGKYTLINEIDRKIMNLETLYKSKTNVHLFFNEDCTKAIMELRSYSIIEDPRYSKIKEVLDLLNKEEVEV
jgi:hypothetical protein